MFSSLLTILKMYMINRKQHTVYGQRLDPDSKEREKKRSKATCLISKCLLIGPRAAVFIACSFLQEQQKKEKKNHSLAALRHGVDVLRKISKGLEG